LTVMIPEKSFLEGSSFMSSEYRVGATSDGKRKAGGCGEPYNMLVRANRRSLFIIVATVPKGKRRDWIT
jgi:hypothetical protein